MVVGCTVHHLLDDPHHDGSPLYVSTSEPSIGEEVTVRVRVPRANVERAVHLRTVRDGEPRIAPARLVATTASDRWYEAEVLVHNPVTCYRFLLDEPAGYRWLNGRGVHRRDVPDAADFRLTVHAGAPAWMSSTVVYQVFPDRFGRSAAADERAVPPWAVPAAWGDEPLASGPDVGRQLFGGDLRGIEERLDHLEALGVGTLYLTPIFPGRSNHRYDASTFDSVDPLLGGDDALVSLVRAAHARGLRIVGDITTNHTGADHEWFRRALADPSSIEASFYYWTDEAPGHVGWLEHASLPKLDYRSHALRERMIDGPGSVVARWLDSPFGLDGWRVDVANMTGRYADQDETHDVARTIRGTVEGVDPEAVLVAEHFHDAGADMTGDGWHATMNYSAFTRPVWSWLVSPTTAVPALGLPAPMVRRTGRDMVATMRDFDSAVPWTVTAAQWNLLGSHDTARIRSLVGPDLVEVAAGLLFTYPGTPVLFAGDELGLEGLNGEHARATMPWDRPERRDDATFAVYRALVAMRRSSEALRTGGLRWVIVEDDAVAFLRETPEASVLVLLARAPWPGACLPPDLVAPGDDPVTLHGRRPLERGTDGWALPGEGPAVHVWQLRGSA